MTAANEDEASEGALAALTILDLSEGIAGPYTAKLFADYGARVIKVERPGVGDASRRVSSSLAAGFIPQASQLHEGPGATDDPRDVSSDSDPPSPLAERGLGGEVDTAPAFLYVNTNKESLTLDYETEAGAAILHRLIEDADGLIEDVPSRRQAALGLDTASLLAHVPRLVICRVSAFAPSGPRAEESYDVLGGAAAEYSTGLHAFAAMLAALWNASQTEHGQVIEVDALSSLASELGPLLTQALNGAASVVIAARAAPFTAPLELVSEVEHPVAAVIKTAAGPFELDETPWSVGRAPLLGEHTGQVLGEIDIEASEIEALRREGVV